MFGNGCQKWCVVHDVSALVSLADQVNVKGLNGSIRILQIPSHRTGVHSWSRSTLHWSHWGTLHCELLALRGFGPQVARSSWRNRFLLFKQRALRCDSLLLLQFPTLTAQLTDRGHNVYANYAYRQLGTMNTERSLARRTSPKCVWLTALKGMSGSTPSCLKPPQEQLCGTTANSVVC